MITGSRIRRAWAVTVCTAALGLAGVAAAATPASAATTGFAAGGTVLALARTGAAVADTDPCGTGSSSGNVNTCMSVDHTGLHIVSATGSARVINSERTLQVCIRGPQGTIGCTPFLPVVPGGTLSEHWSPNSNEPAGDYCANTYRLNSDGSDTQIGHECVNVQA